MRLPHHPSTWTIVIVLALIAMPPAALLAGRYAIGWQQLSAMLWPSAFPHVVPEATAANVMFHIRLPRVALALFAGAGMSATGTAYQAIFANPLATPDTLGVASGASFGAALGILFGWSALGIQAMALMTGLIAIGLVYLVSRVRETPSIVMIILSGLMVGALFTALLSLVKYVADPQDVLPTISFWLMGSLAAASTKSLGFCLPFLMAGGVLVFLLRWRLNALTLPDDEARSLGVPVTRLRLLAVLSGAIVTAAVVSTCGLIGWVGLLVPHMARMIYGNDNARVVPGSMALGALFLLVVDTLARSAAATEIPVSILTAVVGAPFFIALLRRTGGFRS